MKKIISALVIVLFGSPLFIFAQEQPVPAPQPVLMPSPAPVAEPVAGQPVPPQPQPQQQPRPPFPQQGGQGQPGPGFGFPSFNPFGGPGPQQGGPQGGPQQQGGPGMTPPRQGPGPRQEGGPRQGPGGGPQGGGMPFFGGDEGGDEGDPREFIDPRQIQDALRQIKDIRRETTRLLKQAKKAADPQKETDLLNGLLSQLTQFETTIRAAKSHDDLQEFFEAQLWDVVNEARARIELPNEMNMIERDLKRLNALLAKTKLNLEGLDFEGLKAQVVEIQNALDSARAALASGDAEGAREHLQIIHEGKHPGALMGIVSQLKGVSDALKRIRQTEVRDEVLDLISPILEAVNAGDFQEANFMLNQLTRELFRFMEFARSKPVVNDAFRQKMQQLEQRLQQSEQQFEQQQTAPKPQGLLELYRPYRPNSMMGNLYYSFMDLLGL